MRAICLCFGAGEGHLLKVLWHDGLGMSLYAKRLDHGRFLWPSPASGVVAISPAQLSYLLEMNDDSYRLRQSRHRRRAPRSDASQPQPG